MSRMVLQDILYVAILIGLSVPLGSYIYKVIMGQKAFLTRAFAPMEKGIYRTMGATPDEEMSVKRYALSAPLFGAADFLSLFLLLPIQGSLPPNPEGTNGTSWHLSFNTAVSFVSNTNWQAHAGESILSYLMQFLGLTVQNFVSAATRTAVLFVLIRGFVLEQKKIPGSFWVDLTRSTLYIFTPLPFVVALLLISQGVVQTFGPYHGAVMLESGAVQTTPLGPAVSQIAIKQLGTNGGGPFGTSSTPSLENPTPFSNFVQTLSILLILAALCVSFGKTVRNGKQGKTIYVTMMIFFVSVLVAATVSEQFATPALQGVAASGSMEGKEVIHGVGVSPSWAAVTTAASNGSVNAMYDSLIPLAGMASMFLMQLGEIVFGGMDSGLYGMLAFVLFTAFIAGLMVGRIPGYLGKKVEPLDMRMVHLIVLAPPLLTLLGIAAAVVNPGAVSWLTNSGAHGFPEILYASSSVANNNGNVFAGFRMNTVSTNVLGGVIMLLAWFIPMTAVISLARNMTQKKTVAAGGGTLSTSNGTSVGLLIGAILITGALSFLSALALGPIADFFTTRSQKGTQMEKKNVDRNIFASALRQSFAKFSPRVQVEDPAMLVVYTGAILMTVLYFLSPAGLRDENADYTLTIALVLWFIVLFANFAEAIAEGHGHAQTNSLRSARKDIKTKKLKSVANTGEYTEVLSSTLKKGDIVYVKTDGQIPMDGGVINRTASVGESAITGESAPVIRESGGDRSAVTGGTTLVSSWSIARVTAEARESSLDKVISMVEGAARKRMPNETVLQILLTTLTIILLVVTATLLPFISFASAQADVGSAISITNVITLPVCLAPTTIGALLSSIDIVGMSRLNQANVLAMSGRTTEVAGDVDVLLLDKIGTIALGNRQASEFLPVNSVSERDLADAAQLSSLADETAEGRSIVVLAKERSGIRGRESSILGASFVEFLVKTRMSGIGYQGGEIRKGAVDTVKAFVLQRGGEYPQECEQLVQHVAGVGGAPFVIAKNNQVLGAIYLEGIVKNGVKERFEDLRRMGIKTIMITGDNPMTAVVIAAEAGVDSFLAKATPGARPSLIRNYRSRGHLVAVTGDGMNDVPALAQADMAVATNTDMRVVKEVGSMVDLDSNLTKLIDIVRIGKQPSMTRGPLMTFSVANDVAKYFAIIPVLFFGIYPQFTALNFMGLVSAASAMLSATIYNALIIVALIPLALKGVKYRKLPAGKLLRRNLLVYGLGGITVPFLAIKLIDILLTACGLA